MPVYFSRSPLYPHPLLCWPLWRCQWNCEYHCELDIEWWRQCWFLPHQHHDKCSPDPIWGTSEHHQWQCHTTWTDWFYCRLWVQHHSTWCQLWESRGEGEWAPNNYSSRYHLGGDLTVLCYPPCMCSCTKLTGSLVLQLACISQEDPWYMFIAYGVGIYISCPVDQAMKGFLLY